MHHILLPLQGLFSRSKNILLYNHSTLIKFRTTLIKYFYPFLSVVRMISFYNNFFLAQHPVQNYALLFVITPLQCLLIWNSSSVFLFYFVFMTFDSFYVGSYTHICLFLLGSLLLSFNCHFREWSTVFLNSNHTFPCVL